MKRLRILVACEFSGIVREAFIAKGQDGYFPRTEIKEVEVERRRF